MPKFANPLPQILPKECVKAARICNSRDVLKRAQGFAFLSVVKAGFLLSARAGSGLVIARLDDDTWSAPSAIGTAGMGIGSQAGAELTEYLFVLNSKSAVRSFMSAGSITLGGSLSVALGPIGRTGEAAGSLSSSGRIAAMYTYSKTKGLFGGVSIEGSVVVERQDANCIAYDSNVTAQMLLSGVVPVPQWADGLIKTIESVTGSSSTPKWVRESGRQYFEEYAFGGMGSPDGIVKKNKSTPKLEFPPKTWGSPKNGGSYFDEWDKGTNGATPTQDGKLSPGKERDLIDVHTPNEAPNGTPNGTGKLKKPFSGMTSPFDTTNADIHISTDHMTSPFDTSVLRRSTSSGRPKPVRTDSETSLKMKARAAKLSNQLEGDFSAFGKLSIRPNPPPVQSQPSLIDYSDDDHVSHSPPRVDTNLPFHLQQVHVDLDKTNVSLPSPKSPGYIKPTLLRKGSSKTPMRKYTDSDSEEERIPQHKRAPSQRFKAQLKEPMEPEGLGRAIVRFDFDAVESGDLPMKKGDIVLILERSQSVDDWWKGKIGSRVGNFPANFVEVVGAGSSSHDHELDPFDQM